MTTARALQLAQRRHDNACYFDAEPDEPRCECGGELRRDGRCCECRQFTESMNNTEKQPALLIVEAGVRYWEDATVNGVQEPESGPTQIPFRRGDTWCPVIELETGKVRDWPEGMTARVHYKVCDAGEYWLADTDGTRTHKALGHYVPDRVLCMGDRGYGDYIILNIGADGKIVDWKPIIEDDRWEELPQP